MRGYRYLTEERCHSLARACSRSGHVSVGLEADPQSGAGTVCNLLESSGRGANLSTLESGDDRLGCLHPLRQLGLSESGFDSGLNQSTGKLKLRPEFIVGRPVVCVPAPLLVQVPNFAHFSTSLARCHAKSISLRGVFPVFLTKTRTTTTRWSRTATYNARDIPSLPLIRISHIGPVRCLTCGCPTRSNPTATIKLTDAYEAGPHIGWEQVKLPLHRRVQGLYGPRHTLPT